MANRRTEVQGIRRLPTTNRSRNPAHLPRLVLLAPLREEQRFPKTCRPTFGGSQRRETAQRPEIRASTALGGTRRSAACARKCSRECARVLRLVAGHSFEVGSQTPRFNRRPKWDFMLRAGLWRESVSVCSERFAAGPFSQNDVFVYTTLSDVLTSSTARSRSHPPPRHRQVLPAD